jgi:predicted small secreted protein
VQAQTGGHGAQVAGRAPSRNPGILPRPALRAAAPVILSPASPPRPEIRMARTIALLLVLALAGCNTMRGLGQDMSAAGDAVSDTANEVQRKM